MLFVKFYNYSRKERKREWEKRKLNVVGVLLCVCFVIIKLLCCRFSAVILKRIQFMLFFLFFLLTHPGQRRHSGDSSYWRRPRDGGRQNKERQGVHARTYGTTHLFNSHTHRELYDLCLIFRFAGFGCEILVCCFTVEYTSSSSWWVAMVVVVVGG